MSTSHESLPQLHWGIVGGGMMGLTIALRLAEQGQRVTVLEAGSQIGGLASAWQLDDFIWDKHYHVTLLSDLSLRKLLEELELEKDINWVETQTGFFTDGNLHSMSNTWEFLRFPPLTMWEKFRLGLTIFYASKIRDGLPLEKIPVADWLKKWSGVGSFEKMWLPLLKAKLGQSYRRVSASFIWSTIARMYRARQSGLKKEMFGYVPGGYANVLARFREKLLALGVEIETATPVKQIVSNGNGTIEIEKASGDVQQFDRVVATTPSSHIARLCPELAPAEQAQHNEIEYLGILCASVVLKRPLANYYVTNITDSSVPFTAVIEMTALVDPAELGGKHLVYLPRYVEPDDEAWQWSDEQLRAEFLSALERMYPHFERNDVLAFKVSRVKQVMALPTLNYSERLPNVETSIENLFIVNSAQIVRGTLNVNEVIDVAESALANHLLPSLKKQFTHPLENTDPNRITHDEAHRELVARS